MPSDAGWPRNAWSRSIWESDLKPLERLAALVYADHAGERDHAWVTLPRLMERTGLSRDAANRARAGLVTQGWLTELTAARQHRAARYQLTVPQGASSRTPDEASGSRTPEGFSSTSPDTSSTSPDTRGPQGVPNQKSYQRKDSSSSSSELEPTDDHESAVVEILARKLRQTTTLAGLRTDKLRPGQGARIAHLVAEHGDQRLVTQALAGLRHDNPPLMIQAFLPGWENIPAATASAPKLVACPHGRAGGQETRGSGLSRSRICGDCEAANPAAATNAQMVASS